MAASGAQPENLAAEHVASEIVASGIVASEIVVSEIGDGEDGDGAAARPRRSGLVQERSRRTRQRLVRAALDLWTERGFEGGVESTTVEEIVQAAGVTKGTFYFHFAHKEDILLEVGFGTSGAMLKDATGALAQGLPVEATIDALLAAVARRLSASPRAAVGRTVEEFYRRRRVGDAPVRVEGGGGFQAAYAIVFLHAQEMGELPSDVDARVLAEMLQALTMGAINRWVHDEEADLLALLRYRAAVMLAGVREVAAARATTR